MNNDANSTPAPFHPDFDRFLTEMIEYFPIDVLETIRPRSAQAILDAMPDGDARNAMRRAFRDNVPTLDPLT